MSKCPYCFNQIHPGVRVCIHCKEDLTKKPKSKSGGGNKWGVFLGTLFVLAAIGYLVFANTKTLAEMYAMGLENGFEKNKNSWYYAMSETYKQGYDDGATQKWYYSQGCFHSAESGYPQHADIPKYMEGFDACANNMAVAAGSEDYWSE